jgi:aminoglycoside/choline kinase family phosphotransferase
VTSPADTVAAAAEPTRPSGPGDLAATPSAAAAPVVVAWPDEARRQAFDTWVAGLAPCYGLQPASVRAASADASFRRYLRVDAAHAGSASLIVMDAPPAKEDCRPFVQVAGLLGQAGLRVPQVLEWDEAHGFMLLADLGETTYLADLARLDFSVPGQLKRADGLYRDAIDALVRLQAGTLGAQGQVPPYDRALMQREIDLFPDWYVARHRGVTPDAKQAAVLTQAVDAILGVCLAQPMTLVHRDFHSRNLMVQPDQPGAGPGVLDFQDAVWGPLAYDLVSLLRDAYIDWDESIQIDWAVRYWEQARKAGLPVPDDFGSFWRDFEWMGLQRHLKVLGIFCRLNYRDGKAAYLADLPRVWRQAHHVAARYSVLRPLSRLLEDWSDVQITTGYTF